jgi:hypothetical protein
VQVGRVWRRNLKLTVLVAWEGREKRNSEENNLTTGLLL